MKRRAAQPKSDGASVDDAITEILMGRKAKHELEARLEQLERASQAVGARAMGGGLPRVEWTEFFLGGRRRFSGKNRRE